jgi:hypothetical protein
LTRISYSTAAKIGRILHVLDRACTFLYLAGAAYVGGILVWKAFTETFWLLLLAIPVLVTTALFAVSYWRNPALGLRLEWPFFRRRYGVKSGKNVAPTKKQFTVLKP